MKLKYDIAHVTESIWAPSAFEEQKARVTIQ